MIKPSTFFLLVILVLAGSASASYDADKRVAGATDNELAPFLWSWIDPVSFTEEGLQKTAAKKDPLRPFFLAFRLLTIHERTGDPKALERAKRALDFMLNEYQPADRSKDGIRWYYGFDYGKGIKAPWWSGMDGFFGPMTIFALWQATGEEKYRVEALKSAKLMLRDPREGGVLWRDGDSCWISEYSWKGMTRDQEYHVLNGHLWGLQALFMLADASGDKDLKEAYHCAKKGTVIRLPQYYNAAGNWTWYQLVPHVINPTHYNTIEIAQFRAMAAITGDSVYKEPEERRKKIFKNAYPLYLVKTRKGLEVQFSMMGAPNAYWTDTYPVTVACKVDNQTVAQTNRDAYSKKPLFERMILRLPVSKVPEHCDVSIHSNVEVRMYRQDGFNVIKDLKEDKINAVPVVTMQGALIKDQKIEITPAKGGSATTGEARVTMDINRDVLAFEMIALVIHSTADSQLGVVLTGADGKTASSYYPILKADRDNIVVLNKLGFAKGGELKDHLSKLMLRIYTKPNTNDFEITIKEASVIRNTANLESFLTRNQTAYFPQQ